MDNTQLSKMGPIPDYVITTVEGWFSPQSSQIWDCSGIDFSGDHFDVLDTNKLPHDQRSYLTCCNAMSKILLDVGSQVRTVECNERVVNTYSVRMNTWSI